MHYQVNISFLLQKVDDIIVKLTNFYLHFILKEKKNHNSGGSILPIDQSFHINFRVFQDIIGIGKCIAMYY